MKHEQDIQLNAVEVTYLNVLSASGKKIVTLRIESYPDGSWAAIDFEPESTLKVSHAVWTPSGGGVLRGTNQATVNPDGMLCVNLERMVS